MSAPNGDRPAFWKSARAREPSTRRIVALLKADDRLDLVELNQAFAGRLEQRFQSEPTFKRAADRARIHVCGIESFEAERPYDFIVSGLPFNNFSPAFVGRVMDAFFNFLAPGGVLSFFEYMYVGPCAVSSPEAPSAHASKTSTEF